jgi:hypothetical protein
MRLDIVVSWNVADDGLPGAPGAPQGLAQSSRDRRGGLCGQKKISLGEWGNFD